jgi:hypothetical protein
VDVQQVLCTEGRMDLLQISIELSVNFLRWAEYRRISKFEFHIRPNSVGIGIAR